MKHTKILIAAGLLTVLLLTALLTACRAGSSIEGRWEVPGRSDDAATTSDLVKLEFFSDGTYASNLSNYSGKYSIDGDRLKLDGVLVKPLTVTFKVDGDNLMFYTADGKITCEFEKVK